MLIPDAFSKFPEARPLKGVLHVGAHTCEEMPLYLSLGLRPEDVTWVDANSFLKPPQMSNYWTAVVSDTDGTPVTFHLTDNVQSSSLLPLKEHLREHPTVREIAQIPMVTTTLNSLLPLHGVSYDRFDVMNLDIQGAELLALKGATQLLPHIKAIYTEVNTRELYEGCALLPELDSYLADHGFSRVATSMTQHGWGDALYLRVSMGVVKRPFRWAGVSDELEARFWNCLNTTKQIRTIMDIGARESTMPSLFPEARVALFEPMPAHVARLHALWGTNPRVSIHPYGLGNTDNSLAYYPNTESFVKRTVHVQSHSPVPLPVRSFHTALKELGWERVDFVKIDTEGYEYTILKSAKELIDKHTIKFIQFEMGGTIFDLDITMHDIFSLFDASWRIYNIEEDALNRIDHAFTWSPDSRGNGNFFATWIPEDELRKLLAS